MRKRILISVFSAAGVALLLAGVSLLGDRGSSSGRQVPEVSLVSDAPAGFPEETPSARIDGLVVDSTGDAWILSAALAALYRIGEASEPEEILHLPEGDWRPTCLAVDRLDNLFVADEDHILRYRRTDRKWDVWAWPGFNGFQGVCALACDATGDLYVADASLQEIVVLGEDGKRVRTVGAGDDISSLGSMAVAPGGEIVCALRKRIQVRSRGGAVIRDWEQESRLGNSKGQPFLAVDKEGFIYLTHPDIPVLEVYDLEGNRLHRWQHSTARGIRMRYQAGIGISSDGTLVVGHSKQHLARFRVQWKPEHEVFPSIPVRKKGPNLLIVTLDTTRFDHLGCYGYERDTSPVLDEIAARGIRFTDAICQAPDTCASHASMMTSLHPFIHRARNLGFYLREEFTTLAEMLRASGYRTAAFLSGFTLGSYNTWLDQGFEVYDNYDSIHDGRLTGTRGFRAADVTTDLAIQWLREHQGEPIFLWVHYFDPHATYEPPEPYQSMFTSGQENAGPETEIKVYWGTFPADDLVAWYDAEVRFMDAEIGRLMQALEELGFVEDLFAIFLGDHGELLGERGRWCSHGSTLFDPEIRIPFIAFDTQSERIKQPQVRSEPVETIDILPTFLAVAELEIPKGAQGVSLLPWLRGEDREWPRPFTWTQLCKQAAGEPAAYSAVRTKEWKYYGITFTKGYRLYHLPSDPEEDDNLANDPQQVTELLGRETDSFPEALHDSPGKMVLYSIAPGLEQLDGLHEFPRPAVHTRFVDIYEQATEWSAPDLFLVNGEEEALDEERASRLRALGYVTD